MAKFEFLCSKDKVAVVRIGNSIYYIDIVNPFDIVIFNSSFCKENIIVPEYWIPEISRGEATLSTLKACMTAYENGFNAAYAIKANRHFKYFVNKLIEALSDPGSARKFLNIFWVELQPFDIVKGIISKIINNKQFRDKSPKSSRIALDRYSSRSKFELDKEYDDIIYRIIQDMDRVVFAPTNELLDVLKICNTNVPMLIQNIDKIIGFRTDARSK